MYLLVYSVIYSFIYLFINHSLYIIIANGNLDEEDVIMSIQHFNNGEEVSKKTTKITISVDASNSNDYNEVTEMPNSDEYYDEYYDAHGQDYIDNTLMGGNPKTYKNKIPQKKNMHLVNRVKR